MKHLRSRLVILTGVLLVVTSLALVFTPVSVQGESMRPTLDQGKVFLTTPLWLADLDRHDLVVFEEPGTGSRAVKRVAGLPGERVRLLNGDLFVNGSRSQRLVHGVAELIPLVDADRDSFAEHFQTDLDSNRFRHDERGWLLESGTAFLRTAPRDGFLENGEFHSGELPASDLGIEVEFAFEQAHGVLELHLRTGTLRYVLELRSTGGAVQYRLRRAHIGSGHDGEVLLERHVAEGPPSGVLFLAKIDQRIFATRDGELLFDPVSCRRDDEQAQVGSFPFGARAEQAGLGGGPAIRILRARVGRDFFWDPSGTYGCASELQLAEDEYFLLGDNPSASRDSRHYGPVPRARLHGILVGAPPPGAAGR